MNRWLAMIGLVLTVVSCAADSNGEDDAMTMRMPTAMTPAVQGIQNSSSGGWQSSGKLRVGNVDQVSLQANFPQANVYTVEFGPVNVAGARPRATITWSVEGGFVSRVVDVSDGTSVTGVGAAVKVVITDNSVVNSMFLPKDTPYDVSMIVSPGSRASSGEIGPTYCDGLKQFAYNDSADKRTYSVPQSAGAKSFNLALIDFAAHAPPTVGQVTVYQNNGTGAVAIYDAASILNQWVPLVAGVSNIILEVHSGTSVNWEGAVIFGIDG